MNRDQRARQAQEAVAIATIGDYSTPAGRVDIRERVEQSIANTLVIRPGDWKSIVRMSAAAEPNNAPAEIEVTGETTLAAARRLVEEENLDRVLALNFASAKNPGGGFLNGSQAQEESLARSSALYRSLLAGEEYYIENRKGSSMLYTDYAIYSPDVPVFRDDDGTLLERPYPLSFITMPAPNVGAMGEHSTDREKVEPTLLRRIEHLLALAVRERHETLVLGAWGCGVFRNDPRLIAECFRDALFGEKRWGWRLRRVVFAVLDRSGPRETFNAFAEAFDGKDSCHVE